MVEELLRRGLSPVAIVRDEQRLRDRGIDPARVETRIASLEDPSSLDCAMRDAAVVINCAGPFLDTAPAVIDASLRCGIHYFDVTAEQGSASHTFEAYATSAHERGIVMVPAAGFYGGLADLLATAALADLPDATEVHAAVALDRWWPTRGTRRTGERNTIPRVAVSGGKFVPVGTPGQSTWAFPQPFGTQTVVEVPLSETIVMARHLRVSEIRHFINETPLNDIRDEATPEPAAVDERGRSPQMFLMETIVRNGNESRRRIARGRDIYAITAPIVVEAAERVLRGDVRRAGAFALAELCEPAEFLQALSLHDLSVSEN